MMMEISYLIVVFLVSFCIIYFLVKYKNVINIQAHINHRSLHTVTVPNSGGIAIFIAFIIGLVLLDVEVGYEVVLSMSIVFVFGLYDDIYTASTREKFLVLFLVANILFFNAYEIKYLGTYLGYDIQISSFASYIFLVFVIVGFINGMNLIDGLDGLVSTIGIIILSSFLYIGLKVSDQFLISITSLYIASLLGYLYFNWSPAKIFMGDNGSLPLGLIIAIIAIHCVQMQYITPISILMLAAFPILDTFFVITQRIRSGKSPFVADKSHIHHIVYRQQKNKTSRTVIILGLMQLLLSYIGLGFKIKDDSLILGLFILVFLILYFTLSPCKEKL